MCEVREFLWFELCVCDVLQIPTALPAGFSDWAPGNWFWSSPRRSVWLVLRSWFSLVWGTRSKDWTEEWTMASTIWILLMCLYLVSFFFLNPFALTDLPGPGFYGDTCSWTILILSSCCSSLTDCLFGLFIFRPRDRGTFFAQHDWYDDQWIWVGIAFARTEEYRAPSAAVGNYRQRQIRRS